VLSGWLELKSASRLIWTLAELLKAVFAKDLPRPLSGWPSMAVAA
jgi:hypothetical protein